MRCGSQWSMNGSPSGQEPSGCWGRSWASTRRPTFMCSSTACPPLNGDIFRRIEGREKKGLPPLEETDPRKARENLRGKAADPVGAAPSTVGQDSGEILRCSGRPPGLPRRRSAHRGELPFPFPDGFLHSAVRRRVFPSPFGKREQGRRRDPLPTPGPSDRKRGDRRRVQYPRFRSITGSSLLPFGSGRASIGRRGGSP